MRKGFSGAEIIIDRGNRTATKRGSIVDEQGRLCQYLNSSGLVCPIVNRIFPCGYEMELLKEPVEPTTEWASVALVDMRTTLEVLVWQLDPPTKPNVSNWHLDLLLWARDAHHYKLTEMFETLPPLNTDYCAIHGDPTLANVMYTRHGNLRICDPLGAGGKIPWLPEVDVGKMLQSVAGWEHVACGWPALFWNDGQIAATAHALTAGLDERRCQFWLAVHLLRIIPYAMHISATAQRWARVGADHAIWDLQQGNGLCSTLSTLTELSRTLARQS